jgi:hypothetical protein
LALIGYAAATEGAAFTVSPDRDLTDTIKSGEIEFAGNADVD